MFFKLMPNKDKLMPNKDYYCEKCGRKHKEGSKIWEKHKERKKFKIQKIKPANKVITKKEKPFKKKKESSNSYNETFIEDIIKEIEDGEEYDFKIPQQELEADSAPIWRRVAAYLIDCLFFYIVLFQIFMMIYLPMVGLDFKDMSELETYLAAVPSAMNLLIIGFVSSLFVFLVYFMLVEKTFNTSLGKKLMKLQIKGERKLTFKDVFLRNITKTVLFFILPLDLMGMVDSNKQRFTEKITKTKVIYYPTLILIYE